MVSEYPGRSSAKIPVLAEKLMIPPQNIRTGVASTYQSRTPRTGMQSSQKTIAILDYGGTFSMRPNADGLQESCNADYLPRVPSIHALHAQGNICVYQGPRLDSTDMTLEQRVEMARSIDALRHARSGLVIVQGTDTMVDTAATLTYMLQGLDLPVVITGAQRSIFSKNSDAPRNLELAVWTAGIARSGVYIAFNKKVVRGVRAAKQDACGFDAFESFRDEPLKPEDFHVPKTPYALFTAFDRGVRAYVHVSGTDADPLDYLLHAKHVTGVVIEGYGTGNVPADVRERIPWFHAAGKPVVVVTGCARGSTEATYATSCAEAIPGGELTRTAATHKLAYALGSAHHRGLAGDRRVAYVRDVMTTPIAYDGAPGRQLELQLAQSVA